MLNMNRVTLLGHAGRDPEVRALNNGNKAASFPLATTERWTDRDGQPAENTEWHRVVAYGAAADAAERLLRKGSAALVEGRLSTREYRDRDGNDRVVTEIVVAGPQGVLNVLGRRVRNADGSPGKEERP
ncbi:MAG: single-stranded DNA-binding protein [Gammaproteobacteria bacterium]|nr:single-stranded DNA-binding protein [Gammaproteobacteria bacterium]MYB12871.1 single-stranded DNA-binding protein [Rhodospirillaceae bacterium]MYI24548.1 single-stranded DNA-binding protein [Gammaproteobacteria bacterium]